MTEKLLAKKRLAFLTDTANFYTSLNLCIDPNTGKCKYAPTASSPGCAIGRHISQKLAIKLDIVLSGVTDDEIFNALPVKLQNLGQRFLNVIQCLHDNRCNWDPMGLSHDGEIQVENIKRTFNLN